MEDLLQVHRCHQNLYVCTVISHSKIFLEIVFNFLLYFLSKPSGRNHFYIWNKGEYQLA